MNTSSTTTSSPDPNSTSPSAQPSANRPRPGRPTSCTPDLLKLLCSIVRATGCSDSRAAIRATFSPSTLSRWKQHDSSVALLLLGAREEFRQTQLEIIQDASLKKAASSWRAAAWLLERVFPEDYHPNAAQREKFQLLAELREQEAAEDPEPEPAPIPTSETCAPAEAQAPVAPEPARTAAAPIACFASERVLADYEARQRIAHLRASLQNSQNSSAGEPQPNAGLSPVSTKSPSSSDGSPLQNSRNPVLTGSILDAA